VVKAGQTQSNQVPFPHSSLSFFCFLKVLHVIPSLSSVHGGPSVALPAMARALAARGIQVDVATTDDDGPGKRLNDVQQGVPVSQEGFRVFHFPKQTEFYKVSLPLLFWLLRNVVLYDVVHGHAVFSFSTLAAGWACRMRGVPYVVRPLGVLSSWGMENRRRRLKAWSFRMLDKPVLDHAAAIHFTSHQEADEAARLGIRARPVVIPLGMDLEPFSSPPSPELFTTRFPEVAGRPVILFLSRLDPKKNVELLLEAMARLRTSESSSIRPNPTESDAILVVAGSGASAYVDELKARALALGLEKQVVWAGHLEGDMKLSALAAATVYVLPSHSENFGIALLEAASAGLPCVAAATVALATDMRRFDAGSLIVLPDGSPDTLAQALRYLLEHPADAKAMAKRAVDLIHQHFSTESMAEELAGLYRDCVVR
jgi:glycosyltransferase involved in cell wall biosynthesis